MAGPGPLQTTLLAGARELLDAHAHALPQRDDLCGAFCGALALNAAGFTERCGEPLDQDAVAVAAGSVVGAAREPGALPHGEPGRRDYRLAIPTIANSDVSGTTCTGVIDAIAELSDGALEAIPLSGPWNAATLDAIFDCAAGLERPVTLIANFATHHLWGGGARFDELLGYLLDGEHDGPDGPEPDWRVGHFACVFGRVRGPGGSLYGVADTYPALGNHGVHSQPRERLAAGLERRDMPAGGMLAVVFAADANAVRAGASAGGLSEGVWDNGTVTRAASG
jgi:hypothetical protein